jgi:tight adherence protein B
MNSAAAAFASLLAGGALLLALISFDPGSLRSRRARRIAVLADQAADDREAAGKADRRLRTERALFGFFTWGLERTWGVKATGFSLLALSIAAAATSIVAAVLLSAPSWSLAPLALVVALGAPRVLLSFEQRRAELAFLEDFPNAVDMIIRMLRAGLPVTAAIRTVAAEAPGAVGRAYQTIGDQIEIGMTLGDALGIAGQRIQLADFRFFCVSVTLQQSTGGNLASTLETLSEIIRKRRAMRLKAKALSSEVRMSSYVLGAMPVLILGALMFLSPGYLAPLIEQTRGRLILGGAALNLSLGFVIMRQMMRRAVAV